MVICVATGGSESSVQYTLVTRFATGGSESSVQYTRVMLLGVLVELVHLTGMANS